MSADLQRFLARLYTDPALRRRFLERPFEEALTAGLDEPTALELAKIDREGLELAAESFARKRARRH